MGDGHINLIFGERPMMVTIRIAKVKNGKPGWVVEKHGKALAGTGFEGCATCAGCTGKAESGTMYCSRAGAKPVLVTVEQAKSCNGTKPPPYHTKKHGRKRVQNHELSAST